MEGSVETLSRALGCLAVVGLLGVALVLATSPASFFSPDHQTGSVLAKVPQGNSADLGRGCAAGGNPASIAYEYFTVDTTAVRGAITSGAPVSIRFKATNFTVVLGAYALVSAGALVKIDHGNSTETKAAPSLAAIGSVVGTPNSTAIVTLTGNYFDGIVQFGTNWYFDSNVPGGPVGGSLHRGWNITVDASVHTGQVGDTPPSCGDGPNGIPPGPTLRAVPVVPSAAGTRGDGGPRPLQIRQQSLLISGDAEYYNLFWWCPPFLHIPQDVCETAQMTTEVALLNFIYNGIQGLGVRTPEVNFNIVGFDIHTPAGNGGMTSFDTLTLVRQYRDHTLAAHGTPDYHAAHLLTGKDLNGDVGGYGGLNTENPSDPDQHAHWSVAQMVGAAGTVYDASNYGRMLLNSHEVGHTYTAMHNFALHFRVCWWIFCSDYYTIMWSVYNGDSAMLARFSDSVTDNRPPAQSNRDLIHAESLVKPLR